MSDHPIQGLMQTAMENIKAMVDVNTIVGEPVETKDGSVILPISKVAFGFAAGGSDFRVEEDEKPVQGHTGAVKMLPFGGGSGGGVSIRPIAFLVVGREGVHIVPLDNQTHIFEKIIDSTPGLIDKIQTMFQGAGGGGGASEYNGTAPSPAQPFNPSPVGGSNVTFTPSTPL